MSINKQKRMMDVLRAPIVSEKSSLAAEKANQAVFEVAIDATKPEIKEAVETLFKVDVKSVSTLVMKGKTKRFGRTTGQRKDWKKAYVRLADGQEIDMVGLN